MGDNHAARWKRVPRWELALGLNHRHRRTRRGVWARFQTRFRSWLQRLSGNGFGRERGGAM